MTAWPDISRDRSNPMFADCWACAHEAAAKMRARGDWAASMVRAMYLCPECGDKRCAKAIDHRNACASFREASTEEAMAVVHRLAVRHAELLRRLSDS